MSSRNLDYLLAPHSVALFGASDRSGSVGAMVMRNLLAGGFDGPIWPVNPRRATVAGRTAYATVADLPETPDLAVICTPARTVPSLIAALGARGTRAAVVLSAGLDEPGPGGVTCTAAMLSAARPHGLRILGPNCVGLLLPRIGLNASFAHANAAPGNLAFIAQSGALTTAMLDWARTTQIGFSSFISLGNAADVDFGDLLDYLCQDPHTHSILLYIEAITGARKFMSAARSAARNKPVIVVKAGRRAEGAKAAASHTGALAGADDVYDAAFRRAGMLRVTTTRELFDAAETLARMKPLAGERLAIVSNGGGPAVMATDALIAAGGELAQLEPATIAALDACLPASWSHADPVDIIGDAPASRYVQALGHTLSDPNVGAVLLIHAPTAIVAPEEIARACAEPLARAGKATLTCWMGGPAVEEAKRICAEARVPTYSTPEEAVGAFLQAVSYQRNQRQLMEVPSSVPETFVPDVARVRAIIREALQAGRSLLNEPEAKEVLAAYCIPVVPTKIAATTAEARRMAAEIGYPIALKILSPDITHKSDVGGVALDIGSDAELQSAAELMLQRCRERLPNAHIAGFTVQAMVKRSSARELIAGVTVDPTFGPVILFGQGGIEVEVANDKAVALPPRNTALAAELISRTRVRRFLAAYRSKPPADLRALELALVQLSQLVVDIAEIVELDINPLLADERGVLALDARMRIAPASGNPADRLAIRPYPAELEETTEFGGETIRLRPIRPEDFPQHREFLSHISAEDMYTRFFGSARTLPDTQLAVFTQIDYERAMAFIAERQLPDGSRQTLGVARAHADGDNVNAEFAILVRSDLKGRGLGSILLGKLIRYCRARGIRHLVGEVLVQNTRMLELAMSLGFECEYTDAGLARVRLELTQA
ncbi:MAG TPA: bifunctional acetate--CoA ligase family protein/GNAT family N-acetyltransferase [Steroidobacteraceae bacterium]|nr:bifunctional acetate--CoA ligase family protein/GNAT family N-acetyltransferase [Steroidobacteraceae bacterium]